MEGKADTPEVLAARDGMLAALKTFEATFLRNSRFVAGDELCIADISIVCGGRPPSTHCSAPQAGFKVLRPLGGRTDAEAPLVPPLPVSQSCHNFFCSRASSREPSRRCSPSGSDL